MSKIENSNFQIRLPLLLSIAVVGGMLIGAAVSDRNSGGAGASASFFKLKEVLNYIQRDYVDEVNSEKLVDRAIESMLKELDPHTVYIDAQDSKITNAQLEGNFDGIGIEFNIFKDTVFVVAPLNGGPSQKAGIRTGDRIVTVDNEQFAGTGITYRDVFNKLRGPKGSEVKLEVKRTGYAELLEFNLTRDKIQEFSVDVSYMVNEDIGYIKVSRFAVTTYDEFKKALIDLKKQGMEKLILDLQGNPGGIMSSAINMVDEVLKGNALIVYTEGKGQDQRAYSQKTGVFEEQPVIVLIDESSASASEIVAGALQDNDRALIVGRRSFGKGLVQHQITLNDGSELRLTVSRYFTPSGRSIQKPYDSDLEDYSGDILARYEHGEFFSKDSIKFNDSLRYSTTGGRAVYGGGGIMPDIFVPFDTTMNSRYLNDLFYTNVIREFAIKYYEDHQEELEEWEMMDFIGSYEVSLEMLKGLAKMGQDADIKWNKEEFERSRQLIKTHVKALLAKSLYGNEGFFRIYNETNEVFVESLKFFDRAEELMGS